MCASPGSTIPHIRLSIVSSPPILARFPRTESRADFSSSPTTNNPNVSSRVSGPILTGMHPKHEHTLMFKISSFLNFSMPSGNSTRLLQQRSKHSRFPSVVILDGSLSIPKKLSLNTLSPSFLPIELGNAKRFSHQERSIAEIM
uniref:Uncharacterized protein n=1 Tax=Arundo donax TaxID=35708 RepID=A0A0A8YCK7_ARUDO